MSEAVNIEMPMRLHPDAVLEAAVEVRFDSTDIPEVVVGRLTDSRLWEDFQQSRTPMADIPQSIRDSDQNLRYQPTIELRRPDGLRAIKIGGHVVSYHVVTTYPGWAGFESEIRTTIEEIYAKIKGVSFIRIGLRYINAFEPSKHHISGISDTNLSVTLNDVKITNSFNLNYTKTEGSHVVTARIATSDIVTGALPPGFSLLFDIDIATSESYTSSDLSVTMAWITHAHSIEKREFFALLPASLISRLIKPGSDRGERNNEYCSSWV